ncbi:YraN family protein [Sphingobacteriaceae bacterium AH-315-L07]|nr:YraN family protein [Sphingobacteriaceae bacterium AH-315-L07]
MAKHNDLGKIGEELALKYLKNKGFEIIECNYRYKRLEVDIIAKFQDKVRIIEVKTRSNDNFGNPEEALSFAKQKRLADAADFYLNDRDIDMDVQFDLMAIIKTNGTYKVEYIEEAFYPYEIE